MAELLHYLEKASRDRASDVFIVPGAPISYKVEGLLRAMEESRLTPEVSHDLIRQIYAQAQRDIAHYEATGDDDFSFSVPGLARFRVNAYRQRGSRAAVIRVVAFSVPDWHALNIPAPVMELSRQTNGMILLTGTAGCGKSTTMACLVDRINDSRACHIITLEDPIEYLHRNKSSIVSQREIAVDTGDYLHALRACLRQAPDVIQLGEMRDLETIRTAMTAAETGHLLLGTLHTRGAVNTVDRIIDIFPADQQDQIRIQLSSVLRTVVSQQLLPDTKGGQTPAFEIMHMTSAIRSLIRDSKNHQIGAAIAAGGKEGMITMDGSILELYRKGTVTREVALEHAENPDQMLRRMEL